MTHVSIYRKGNLSRERAVDITIFSKSIRHYSVDPAYEIKYATGKEVDRYGCIVSMAAGFRAAGFETFHLKIGSRYPHLSTTLTDTLPTTLIYFFFGKCWISGDWSELVQKLQSYVQQPQRLAVLQASALNARHDLPWEKPRLILP